MIDLNEIEIAARKPWYCRSKQEDNLLRPDVLIELITRLREAERDAARYRWLRDNCTTAQADCLGPIFVMTVRRKEHLFNVGLSIDQAMKEKGDE